MPPTTTPTARAGIAIASTIFAAAAGWQLTRTTPHPRAAHLRATVEATERLHRATLGVFKPPKPGEDLDHAMLEMEAAGDRIYTVAAMWLQDRVIEYTLATPAERPGAAARVHEAVGQLRADLQQISTTDPVIAQAWQDVSRGLDQIDQDVP